ncbi:hypothetical protein AAG906_002581 [Vitis piasezkii]
MILNPNRFFDAVFSYLIPLFFLFRFSQLFLSFSLPPFPQFTGRWLASAVGAMAVSIKLTSTIVVALGLVSFIFGVVAENKKPPAGTPVPGKGVVICQYPSAPTVALGFLATVFTVIQTVVGFLSLFYPYKGRAIPKGAFLESTRWVIFVNIALATAGLGFAFLLWPTVTEHYHLSRNVHHDLETQCPTAKTGLLGGGAFLALDSSLFWLICLMLTGNVREDFFEEVDQDYRGDGQVIPFDDYAGAPGNVTTGVMA